MLLLEGFEGEKSSNFLQELMGLVRSSWGHFVSPGLGLSVLSPSMHPLFKSKKSSLEISGLNGVALASAPHPARHLILVAPYVLPVA